MASAELRVGKYTLLAELGRGGMARVFLALASGPAGFRKLVVIKQIQAHLADDPEFLTMFLDEARLAARLNHANIVQTNEVGDEDGYYLAMEFLEGQSFRRVLNHLGQGEDQALTLAMNLRVTIEALAGLQYAHDLVDYDGSPLHVVHRDISPDNVFVTYDGTVKLVDFGIAKAVSSSVRTTTGVVKGKVAYMAPEQAMGDPVDRRADLFSVGVILWELAAGKRLFKGLPDVAILHQLDRGYIPRPSTQNPEVDADFEAIVMRALAIAPDDRFQTADELSAALRKLLSSWNDETTCRDVGRAVADHFAEERVELRRMVDAAVQQTEAEGSPTELPHFQLGSKDGASGATEAPGAAAAPPADEPTVAEGATGRRGEAANGAAEGPPAIPPSKARRSPPRPRWSSRHSPPPRSPSAASSSRRRRRWSWGGPRRPCSSESLRPPRTHRFARWTFIGAGGVTAAAALGLAGATSVVVAMTAIILGALAPLVFSYAVHVVKQQR